MQAVPTDPSHPDGWVSDRTPHAHVRRKGLFPSRWGRRLLASDYASGSLTMAETRALVPHPDCTIVAQTDLAGRLQCMGGYPMDLGLGRANKWLARSATTFPGNDT